MKKQRSIRQPSSTRGGFTLIEALGVVMVMALLAMALVPSLIRELDREARTKEAATLARLADGLVQHITRTHGVPVPTEIPSRIAAQLGLLPAEVLQNDRGQQRVFLMDPAVTNRLPIPYTQTHLGVASDLGTTLGVLIVSSVGNPLPASLVSGMAESSSFFQNLWSASEGTVPSQLTWTGQPTDLRIQRVNLATLFVPLILNYDAYNVANNILGRFTIDGSATNTLPTSPVFTSNFIKGTVLGLHDDAGQASTTQAREVLQHPMSYMYQSDVWRGSLFVGPGLRPPASGGDLQAAEDVFVGSALNPTAQGNPQTTPDEVIQAMVEFMSNYVEYASSSSGETASNLVAAQQAVDDTTEDILHVPEVADGDNDTDGDGYGENVHDQCTPQDHANGHCHDTDTGGGGTCSDGGHHDGDGHCNHGGNDGAGCTHGNHGDDDHGDGHTGGGNCNNGDHGNGDHGDGNCDNDHGNGNGNGNGDDHGNCNNGDHGNGDHGDGNCDNGNGNGNNGDLGDDDHGDGNCDNDGENDQDNGLDADNEGGGGNCNNGDHGNGDHGDGNCDGDGHSNNGHGNNADGVDSSNPGKGNGGPTGDNNSGNDPSGGVDDENGQGNSGNAGDSGSSGSNSGCTGKVKGKKK